MSAWCGSVRPPMDYRQNLALKVLNVTDLLGNIASAEEFVEVPKPFAAESASTPKIGSTRTRSAARCQMCPTSILRA